MANEFTAKLVSVGRFVTLSFAFPYGCKFGFLAVNSKDWFWPIVFTWIGLVVVIVALTSLCLLQSPRLVMPHPSFHSEADSSYLQRECHDLGATIKTVEGVPCLKIVTWEALDLSDTMPWVPMKANKQTNKKPYSKPVIGSQLGNSYIVFSFLPGESE